jgi:2'-5' RNA ligase
MQTEESYRLFIALPVPEEVKDAIERTQSELRQQLPRAGVSWTKRAQFHLTLKFLGNIPAGSVKVLVDSVQSACAGVPTLGLQAKGIGCFPNGKSPRVVWVGVQDDRNLLPDLQRTIDGAVREFTEQKAEGRFTGHVTLGRVKHLDRSEAATLGSLVARRAETVFGGWTGDEVEIIRSELSSGGSRYTTLAKAPLLAR